MVTVVRYNHGLKEEWNKFAGESRNGTFLFQRNFMDYHSDRFSDHSVMLYKDSHIIALFPANEEKGKISSHAGLTYGGLIIAEETRLQDVINCFYSILNYYEKFEIESVFYKQIPYYYFDIPSFEDEYVLFLLQAKLYRRDASFLLEDGKGFKLQKGKKSNIGKAKKENVTVRLSTDYSLFWDKVLTPNLLKSHNIKPVHTKEEMNLLAEKFPKNIKLHIATIGNEIVAGTVLFINRAVINVQYISANERGKNTGALDYLFCELLTTYKEYKYFNFGIANEKDGYYLNTGLAQWKEGFGARSVSHNFYEINLANHSLLEKYVQ